MEKSHETMLPKPIQNSKEELYEHDKSSIKPSIPRPTKYDYILSVIEDYLVLEATNFGMPAIAEYHVVSDSLGITQYRSVLH
jgi:hypothetical protein